jgi:hypothetical protein
LGVNVTKVIGVSLMGRTASFDALRVLCMCLIIWRHFDISGLRNVNPDKSSVFWWYFTNILFSISVDCMAGMSGFFGVNSTRFNVFRVLTLYVQVRCYAFCGYLLADYFEVYTGTRVYRWSMQWVPVLGGTYWYASAYLIMVWVTPGLNYLARLLSRRQYLLVIVGLLVIEVDNCRAGHEGRRYQFYLLNRGYSASHLGIMYFLGGYCKLHSAIVPRIVIFLCYVVVFRIAYENERNPGAIQGWMVQLGLGLWNCNFDLDLGALEYTSLISISLTILTLYLCAVLNVSGPVGSGFTFLGLLSFASYLIHDHPVCSAKLGDWWFRKLESIPTPEMALINGYCYTISVFLFCGMIDMYRQYSWDVLVTAVLAMRDVFEKINIRRRIAGIRLRGTQPIQGPRPWLVLSGSQIVVL